MLCGFSSRIRGFSSRRAPPWHTKGTISSRSSCFPCGCEDQPWGLNPELLKSLFSLCLKWDSCEWSEGWEGSADVYTSIHGAAIRKSGVCGCPGHFVGGQEPSLCSFHLFLTGFPCWALPSSPQHFQSLPIQDQPFSMTRLACAPWGFVSLHPKSFNSQ